MILPALLLVVTTSLTAQKGIVGIGITGSNNHCYMWHQDGTVSSGTYNDLDKYRRPYSYTPAPGKHPHDIVGIAIAGSNDHVYIWYKNGTVSSGTSKDFDSYRAPYSYSLPPGKTPADIVGIGIAGSNDHVYVWYKDGTASSGTSKDLDTYHVPYSYSLPPDKTPADIVGIGIHGSNDHVYAWYKDGSASSGNSRDLDRYKPLFAYSSSVVLHVPWKPKLTQIPVTQSIDQEITETGHDEAVEKEFATKMVAVNASKWRQISKTKISQAHQSKFMSTSTSKYSAKYLPTWTGGYDAMVAVGQKYMIASDHHLLVFMDKQGNQLPTKNSLPTQMRSGDFFSGFLNETNADGSVNYRNINLHLHFPNDTTCKNATTKFGAFNFCIYDFYDTRALYDPVINRFVIVGQARHEVLPSYYTDSNGEKVAGDYSQWARRYKVFAVSVSEDPRDGFNQYISTESNVRDWPWGAVNGAVDALVLCNRSGGSDSETPAAVVFSLNALMHGSDHPPNFRYYSADVGGGSGVLPAWHYDNHSGYTFFVKITKSTKLDIYAFPKPSDFWKAPSIRKTSVTLASKSYYNDRLHTVYRRGIFYIGGLVVHPQNPDGVMYHVACIPITATSTAINAITSTSLGFREAWIGIPGVSGVPWAPNQPFIPGGVCLTVNKSRDIMVAYERVRPDGIGEVCYNVWDHRRSGFYPACLGHTGETPITSGTRNDYNTVVVDPSDDQTFWMAIHYRKSGNRKRCFIGKVGPAVLNGLYQKPRRIPDKKKLQQFKKKRIQYKKKL